MTQQTLPILRVGVDWDGDGYINRGPSTDPRNLATNPLTLLHAVRLYDAVPAPRVMEPSTQGQFGATPRGLFTWAWQPGAATSLLTQIGYNKGGAGNYELLFTPTATGNYTIQFYFNIRTGVAPAANRKTYTISVKNVYNDPADTTNITQTALVIPDTTNGAKWITYNFTVNSISNMKIGLEISASSGAQGSALFNGISGFSVWPGGTYTQGYSSTDNLRAFNVGTEISKYDDITQYVESAQWQLGATGPFDTVVAEGTANIQLKNTTKFFSSEDTSSPFFSFDTASDPSFPTGRYPYSFPVPKNAEGPLITIDVQNPSTLLYIPMWSGFIDSFDVGTGQSNPTASITAMQGLFSLDQRKVDFGFYNAQFTYTRYYDGSFDGIVTVDAVYDFLTVAGYIIRNNFTSAVNNNQAAVNKVFLDNNFSYSNLGQASLQTYSQVFATRQYPNIYAAWSKDTTALQAMRDLLEVDQGFFFLDRSGQPRYITNDYIYTDDPNQHFLFPDVTLDNLLSNLDDYALNQTKVNEVKVHYYPSATQSGQLWSSKVPIAVPAKSTTTTTIKFQYPEGTTIAVQKINSFNASVSPSTSSASDATGVALPNKPYTIRAVLKNGEADIIITNTSTVAINVSVTLNGTSIITYGSSSVTVSSPKPYSSIGAQSTEINNKLVDTEAKARALASHLIAMLGKRYASFSSITINSRDATWLNNILTLTMATRIKYKENPNTGGLYHRVMIVGESAQWTPGNLVMQYTLRPADQYPFLTTDLTYYKVGGVSY